MVAPAPIAYSNRVTVHRAVYADGATNPTYSEEILTSVPAEVRQVSGGEIIRGKTVEAITSFVVSMRWIPPVTIEADCQVTVNSGPYAGQVLWVNRVLYEDQSGRPIRQQLHCRTRKK